MGACDPRGFLSLDSGVSEVGAWRSLQRNIELRLIFTSEEARANQANRWKRQRDDERSQCDQNHRHPVIERPRDQSLVALRHPVEPVVELLERARNRIAVLAGLHLRIGPVRRQHGIQRERHEQRYEHRRRNRQGERLEPLPGHAVHERHRNEYRDDRERCRSHGETDFVGALVRCRHVILTHLDVAHDVLAHHDRVVDQNSDRERQAEE